MEPNRSETRPKPPLPRACVEQILREAGFVLWLTRQVRRDIRRAAATTPADRALPGRAEDQPPFTAA